MTSVPATNEPAPPPAASLEGPAGTMVEALTLIVPPEVADVLASPFIILMVILGALTDSAAALVAPSLLLITGMIGVQIENRLRPAYRAPYQPDRNGHS